MAWDDDLTGEQIEAASYADGHGRLLAGPGTGKTLVMTRRVAYLVNEMNVLPTSITALTFTRHAAGELKQRVVGLVDVSPHPRVSTLHSFALRQLLRNAGLAAESLPQPLRIADDFEERYIIQEDLKNLLGRDLDAVEDALNRLSADWETLNAETNDWEQTFPDPEFLGAWREHRQIYGYTLRAELVFRLKRALGEHPEFSLEGASAHVLVDEYQDLNRCDLAVIKALADRGATIYAAGDDDQSIYGFRYAHPEGIRRFEDEYEGAITKPLKECKRCDRQILRLGLFVAEQDFRREDKALVPEPGRAEGEVALLRFRDQWHEAVATICRRLIDVESYEPHDILVLLRQDRNGVYSSVLRQALADVDVPVAVPEEQDPFGALHGQARPGRQLLALLRLAANPGDSLAWRTLLEIRRNGIGRGAISAVYDRARVASLTFAAALDEIAGEPGSLPRFGRRLSEEYRALGALAEELARAVELSWSPLDPVAIVEGIRPTADIVIEEDSERELVLDTLIEGAELSEPEDLPELLRAVSAGSSDIEQHIEPGTVNILTMHKAKGLTARAVIVVAAEDEVIPGRARGTDEIDDARRLLYVSLTRAKHYLFITYCSRRRRAQSYTGRNSGTEGRNLTQFLREGPLTPTPGARYAEEFLAA